MKKKLTSIAIAAFIIGLSIWLYTYDQAAEPGVLSSAHQSIADCETCHIPWRGVSEQACLQCHYFGDATHLKPQIRFHAAEKNCLDCHSEHRGATADIARVDHTIFNGELSCTRCHFEAHNGKFGDNCRACHDISTWNVEGFRHPPAENKKCFRCHAAPASHYDSTFWEKIRKGHKQSVYGGDQVSVKECWRCHTTHRWGHLMMAHELQ